MHTEKRGTLRNLLTGATIEVTASTEHAASSYGRPVWVTEDGQAVGQVGAPLLGFELVARASAEE